MTRINIIPPKKLTDQHLIAEYRELPMVFGSLRRTLKSKKGLKLEDISKYYTLNRGHVMFFYDKLEYLNKRYKEIISEMENRGYQPDPNREFNIKGFPLYLYNDWKPSNKDFDVIYKRLTEKINMKIDWYRYYGKPIDSSFIYKSYL